MGIACDNSDKVGWLQKFALSAKLRWCAKASTSLYWYRLSFFPFPMKFFARLSSKKAAFPFLE
jgi:hypothetical protein